MVLHAHPGLVLAEHSGVLVVEAAEVEEAQGGVGDHPLALGGAADRPGVQVPVGDVEAGVSQEVKVRGHTGNQVDPTLVDEETPLGVQDAVGLQALSPPVQELVGELPRLHADEAEVVCAGDEDVLLAWAPAVARHWAEVVRREDELVLMHAREDIMEWRVDPHVGVEVDRSVVLAVGGHPAEQPRLDGRGQLQDVVQRAHRLESLYTHVARAEDREGLLVRAQVTGGLVDHQHVEVVLGMVGSERAGEHPGVGRIVLCDDGADVHGAAGKGTRGRPLGLSFGT